MLLDTILGSLALVSLGLVLWQWWAAQRFPLHQRRRVEGPSRPVTVLKPLKGCDEATEECLRSWFEQQYGGALQIVFGVATAEDLVCVIVRRLQEEFPSVDAELMVCGPLAGANLKVSKLARMREKAKYGALVVSDADVRVEADFLTQLLTVLDEPGVGLACSLYRVANPVNWAMRWEAMAVNGDFWSQVLQARSIKPLSFALGAAMAMRAEQLDEAGGFEALLDCLADDYQLGNRIARRGYCIGLSNVVAECWSAPQGWAEAWKHQLRWARTIRVCQPGPYFLSILSNGTIWPWLWLLAHPSPWRFGFAAACSLIRLATAIDLECRMMERNSLRSHGWLAPLKDLLQGAIWALAFVGNSIEWRGERLRVRRGGMLERA